MISDAEIQVITCLCMIGMVTVIWLLGYGAWWLLKPVWKRLRLWYYYHYLKPRMIVRITVKADEAIAAFQRAAKACEEASLRIGEAWNALEHTEITAETKELEP